MTDEVIAAPAAAELKVSTQGDEPRVDSRLLAGPLGIGHRYLFRQVVTYEADFAKLGIVRFENAVTHKRGMPARFAMLTEDQAHLLLAYSKNTEQARALKVRLVQAFRAARDQLEGHITLNRADYEYALRVERDAAVSQALGRFGSVLMHGRKKEKPGYEQALAGLRVSLQLELPWPK